MMRRLGLSFGLAALLGAVAAGAAGQDAPPAPSTAPASRPADPFAAELSGRLESPDPAVRAAAYKELAGITRLWGDADMLVRMAQVADDPALKALFQRRAAELRNALQENQPVAAPDPAHLPAVTISLHNAALEDIATALNGALGGNYFSSSASVPIPPLAGLPNGVIPPTDARATLDMRDKPLWEAMQLISAARPLAAASGVSSDGTIRLVLQGTDLLAHAQVNGPAILIPGTLSMRRTINLQVDPKPIVSLTVPLTLAIDPRVQLVRSNPVTVRRIEDDLGHVQIVTGMGSSSPLAAQGNVRTTNAMIEIPEIAGKHVTVVCETHVEVASKTVSSSLEDVEHALNRPVALGQRTVRVMQFSVSPAGQVTLQVTVTTGPDQPGAAVPLTPAAAAARADSRVVCRVYDATGKTIVLSAVTGASSTMRAAAAGLTGPYKLVLSAVDETRDMPLNFELKDLALP